SLYPALLVQGACALSLHVGEGLAAAILQGGEGTPVMTEPFQVTVGKDMQEMLENDLSLALEGLPVLQRAIVLCLEQAETGSRELLEHLLVSPEDHPVMVQEDNYGQARENP